MFSQFQGHVSSEESELVVSGFMLSHEVRELPNKLGFVIWHT